MMKWLKYEFYQTTLENGEDITITKEIPWNEANEEIAKQEAYGEITVEDDGEPDPAPAPADDDEYADMAAAIREGVNGI